MKKLFLTTAIIAIVMVSSANAACNGGTEYTIEGDTFCISSIKLNWWSAANWCKANGRHLATMYEACPDWNGNLGDVCGRTLSYDGRSVWTATASDDDSAFFITMDTIRSPIDDTGRQYSYFALCAN